MAEAMQGIMGLEEGMPQEEGGQLDPSMFSPVIEGYARTNPRQFSREILGGIAEADPAVAQQFVTALSSMQLPAEVIDALQLMVDEILKDPESYQEDRAELIKEGVPEELLPEQFDPAYFAAFNLALDQLDMNQPAAVPAFANGGIIDVKKIAKELAGMGRNGDTMLAHITPSEARMLRKMGGSDTINPDTGLPEFFLKKAFKSVGKVFKSVGKAIKGVVKGIGRAIKSIAKSTIGKIALTFAAVYFMGPAGFNVAAKLGVANAAAATAVNTFAGSALVNVASGQKIGDALKGAALSAAVAGVTTGVMDGFSTTTAPAAPAPVIDKSINLGGTSGTSLDNLATLNTATPTSIGQGSVTASTPLPGQATFGQPVAAQPFPNYTPTPVDSTALSGGINNIQAAASPYQVPDMFRVPETGFSAAPYEPSMIGMSGTNTLQNAAVPQGGIANVQTPPVGTEAPGFLDSLKQGASTAYKNISPTEIQNAAIPGAQEAGSNAIKELVAKIPDATPAMKQTAYDAAYKAALPDMLSKYGPLATIGLGAAALGGAFDTPKQPVPDNIDQFKTTGQDLLNKDPNTYGLTFGGVNTTYAPNPYEKLYAGYATPQVFKRGGEAFPRKTGPINGPGTGTSDSVPAMLSDGEFVFTAKAVRAMGQGSRRKGAKRMYALMKQLEKKG